MGGAAGYKKIWRRAVSSLAMTIIIALFTGLSWWLILSYGLLYLGCSTYAGFLNYFVRIFWEDINMDREYWWNFWCENIIIQSSVLPFAHNPLNILFILSFALVVSLSKILIDKNNITIFGLREDVFSELCHGGLNALGIMLNLII